MGQDGNSVRRREFLGLAASCGAHLLWVGGGRSPFAFASDVAARDRVVQEEPWGRLEAVADGIWALISPPLTGDRTTGRSEEKRGMWASGSVGSGREDPRGTTPGGSCACTTGSSA